MCEKQLYVIREDLEHIRFHAERNANLSNLNNSMQNTQCPVFPNEVKSEPQTGVGRYVKYKEK